MHVVEYCWRWWRDRSDLERVVCSQERVRIEEPTMFFPQCLFMKLCLCLRCGVIKTSAGQFPECMDATAVILSSYIEDDNDFDTEWQRSYSRRAFAVFLVVQVRKGVERLYSLPQRAGRGCSRFGQQRLLIFVFSSILVRLPVEANLQQVYRAHVDFRGYVYSLWSELRGIHHGSRGAGSAGRRVEEHVEYPAGARCDSGAAVVAEAAEARLAADKPELGGVRVGVGGVGVAEDDEEGPEREVDCAWGRGGPAQEREDGGEAAEVHEAPGLLCTLRKSDEGAREVTGK